MADENRSVMNPQPKKSLVMETFKQGFGGLANTTLGLGAAAVDGAILMKEMFVNGKSMSEALKLATRTRETMEGLNELTGLPFTRDEAIRQGGPMGGAAFEVGAAFSPTRGVGATRTAGKTALNTGVNLGIEGTGELFGEGTALAISAIPGLGSRSAREALAASYAGKLSADQIERIKNGTITLAEITNDPALMATQRRLQSDPATAGRFQEFDRNAANKIETRLQAATPRSPVNAGNTPEGLVSSAYKAYERQTEGLKNAKQARADRDFARVKKNLDPDEPVLDAGSIVDKIDAEIKANELLKQTDEVKSTIAGLRKLRENFFEKVGTDPGQNINEKIQLLGDKRKLLEDRLANAKTDFQKNSLQLQINSIDRQLPKLLESGEPMLIRKDLSMNEIQAQLSQWSGKMFTGDGLFEGVSPSVSKRLATTIFNAYGDAIKDTKEAFKQGTGRSEVFDALVSLDTARKNYKNSMDRLDAFQNRELSKYFGSPENVAALTSKPDVVMEKIASLAPNERQVAFDIIRKQLPDGENVVQGLRASQWEKMIEKARVKGGSDTSVRFNVNKFLAEMDTSDERLLLDMIPDAAQRAEVRSTLAEMRIMARRNDWNVTEKQGGGRTEAVAAVAATGGVRSIVASGLVNIMNDIKAGIVGPDRLLNMMLDPSFKGKNTGERLLNFTKATTRVATPDLTDLSRAIRPVIDTLNEPQPPPMPSQGEDEALPPPPPEGFFGATAAPEAEDLPPPPPAGFWPSTAPSVAPTGTGSQEQKDMKVMPMTQKLRDEDRKAILQEEYNKTTDPDTKASIGRELARIK